MIKNSDFFKALGEETRYRIIKNLIEGEKCACALPNLIKRTQSNTSMQLAKLLKMNILKYKREGKRIKYSIKDKRVIKLIMIMEEK